ncbi:sterol 3-beta-glucosyltransferase UGT80A2 isoform X1 [Cryptomeria japonica]|uniref:sterol 3-beta-glucosyltransferase UGT80A2 isoform X1 n=1 Tax=Cryptomeria japonica TaxID=3369 RepID=UPI0027DA3467|nr:sterol 3-beta-glucosyltransferase UGT80A2 isoform X1 [Cryptomeria japonica]XP_057834743.2 sterol 3-beta-glucosyltransferase UGT80A2 isoform X1 [Cryptomeria japonica]XP_057834749.2 sterol 3-beta-glucosyltransferase UGT80A2 isoform X1 [Cryptomeria japonica]XP_057834754.2 sterol 3-beta-glucosyltransferase UGT80A2 isoform X1 [Cryptomeria japonica]XP_057834762.2 sterol 3-beta-glucosyltransferase UGT80A2 isoform X1 [Cryptomeria japonica]XP_057834768.2 sterol 3-beta-glucosyltransferase UGT80A2 iso
MDTSDRVEVEDFADETSSSGYVISQISSSGEKDKPCCNGAISTVAHLDHTESTSDHKTPKITESENPDEGLQTRCNVKDSDCVHPNTENFEIEAQTVTSELSKLGSDGKQGIGNDNGTSIVCSQLSGADEDERHQCSFEHNNMFLNEENVDNRVDTLQMKLTTSMACGVLTTCVKGKQLSSEEEISEGQKLSSEENNFEGQKESDSVGPNEEPSDRGLIRANTMPSKSSNYDVSTCGETDEFKRSATERRKGNKTQDNENILPINEKMSIRKKLKMMKKFAMVKGDGTVEFDVHSSARFASDLFPSIETPCDLEEDEDEDEEKPNVPPLQIAMLIVGTRGDVQPFIAIGKHLQEYGHRVRLATHSNFEEFVLTAGLEFYPLGGDPKVLAECMLYNFHKSYMVKNKGFLPSGPSEIAIQRKQLKSIINSLLPACTEPYPMGSGVKFRAEAILANPPAYGHVHVAEALKVPIHIFFTMPWTPTSKFPHPLSRVKQTAGYRLSYQVVDSLIWLGIRSLINDFRKKKLKLRPVTYLSGTQGSITDLPTGYIWSPHLVPKPEDWGPKVDVVGFCFLNLASDYTPPESLVKWLAAGQKPIYIGFGSLPVQDPEGMTQIIIKALKETKQRGIINKGWGGLGNLTEPHEFVYTLDNCPHDWLFPRCAAVVHHGGAGTTAAGLKAACPTTIVPFFGDQPFWGERVCARGLGPQPIPVDQFSLARLVAAINFMLDDKVKDNAIEISKAMENEDGVSGAVKAFHKHLPRKFPQQSAPTRESHFFGAFFSGIGKIFSCS